MDKSFIEKKSANATKWSSITEILAKCITPIINIILARLLAPEMFGVVATIMVVISFAEIFTDAGFQKYIMQHEFASDDELNKSTNVAFITNFIISLLLWGVICIFNNQLASLLGVNGKGIVIIIAAISIPLVSFSSIQMARFKRDFDFKSLFIVRVIVCVIPLVVTVPLAIIFRSYWALIIGTLFGNFVNAVLLTLKSKWKPSLYFSFSVLKQMFSYSWWILLESIAVWLTSYLGTFIVGQYLSLHYVGLYNTGINTVNQITSLITAATSAPLFVTLSRLQHDDELMLNKYYSFIKSISLIIVPIGFGIYMFRDTVTYILLGSQWAQVSDFIGMWGLSSSFSLVLGTYCNGLYNAKGKTYLSFLSQILHLVVLIPVIIWGAQKGFTVLSRVRAVVRIELILVQLVFMKVFIKASIFQLFKSILPAVIASLIMSAAAFGLDYVSSSIIWQLISIVLCIAIYFILIYLYDKKLLTELLSTFGIKINKENYKRRESDDGILEKCNFIKVVMMLVVILCHSVSLWARGGWFNQAPAQSSKVLAYLSDWFGTFHVYTFVFVSGYLFYYLKVELGKYNTFGALIGNKSKRLLIPYAVVSLIWVIPAYLLFFNPTAFDIIKNYAFAIAPSQLWFVIMLFGVFFLFYPFLKFFEEYSWIYGCLFCLILYGIGVVCSSFVPNVFSLFTTLKYFIFFYFGFAIRKYKCNFLINVPWYLYFALQVALYSLYYFVISVQQGMIFTLLSIALHSLCAVVGVLMVVTLAKKIKVKRLESSKVYKLLSKHNFVMYLFHQQLIYCTISLLNGVLNPYLLAVVNFVFATVVSLGIAILINKIPKIKTLFGYKG